MNPNFARTHRIGAVLIVLALLFVTAVPALAIPFDSTPSGSYGPTSARYKVYVDQALSPGHVVSTRAGYEYDCSSVSDAIAAAAAIRSVYGTSVLIQFDFASGSYDFGSSALSRFGNSILKGLQTGVVFTNPNTGSRWAIEADGLDNITIENVAFDGSSLTYCERVLSIENASNITLRDILIRGRNHADATLVCTYAANNILIDGIRFSDTTARNAIAIGNGANIRVTGIGSFPGQLITWETRAWLSSRYITQTERVLFDGYRYAVAMEGLAGDSSYSQQFDYAMFQTPEAALTYANGSTLRAALAILDLNNRQYIVQDGHTVNIAKTEDYIVGADAPSWPRRIALVPKTSGGRITSAQTITLPNMTVIGYNNPNQLASRGYYLQSSSSPLFIFAAGATGPRVENFDFSSYTTATLISSGKIVLNGQSVLSVVPSSSNLLSSHTPTPTRTPIPYPTYIVYPVYPVRTPTPYVTANPVPTEVPLHSYLKYGSRGVYGVKTQAIATIYASASTNATQLLRVHDGAALIAVGGKISNQTTHAIWRRVLVNGRFGYIEDEDLAPWSSTSSGKLLSYVFDDAYFGAMNHSLYIFDSTASNKKQLGVASRGTVLAIYGKRNGYYYVQCGKIRGYVQADGLLTFSDSIADMIT